MGRVARSSKQATALLWAAMSEVYLGGVLVIWSLSPNSADRAFFGARLSTGLVIAALAVTAVAFLLVWRAPRLPLWLRWAVGCCVAVAAGGVFTLAVAGLLGSATSTDIGVSIPLGMGVIGMVLIGARVPHIGAVPAP